MTRPSRPSSTRAWRRRTPRRACSTRWRSIPRRTGSRCRTTRRTTRRRTSGTVRRFRRSSAPICGAPRCCRGRSRTWTSPVSGPRRRRRRHGRTRCCTSCSSTGSPTAREDGVRDVAGAVVAGTTPPWRPADADTAVQTDADAQAWRAAGVGWVGGTLAGVRSKLGYLARLGVTALWVSPVLTQAAPAPGAVASNYHGYATQDFLTVDPRFGDADALRALVDDAHAAGLRVILDVVLNHAGDVFAYEPTVFDARWDGRRVPGGGLADPGGPRAVHARGRRRGLAGRRGAPGRAAPAGELHPPRPDRRLEPVPRVRRGRLRGAQGHRPRQRRAGRLPAVARARGAHPGVLLVAGVRRPRRVPGRRRQAHGSRRHPVLRLGRARVRAVDRQGPLPAGRRDHRVARRTRSRPWS